MPECASTPVPATHGLTGEAPHRTVSGGGFPLGLLPPGAVPPFSPYAVPRFTQCPPPPPDLTDPGPANLGYALTLPSAVSTPAVAQEAAEVMLGIHAVEEKLIDPVLCLVHELVAYACRFTGAGEVVHFALRQVEDALQVTVHDTHAAHGHPGLAAACDERRRAALLRVPDLVGTHLQTWGFGAVPPPSSGTCTWAGLAHSPLSRGA